VSDAGSIFTEVIKTTLSEEQLARYKKNFAAAR
jgi:hypothetical protein